MKQPNPFFKLVALATSVLLVGGFVCYRAGAFNRFLAADAPPAGPASSPALEPSLASTTTEGGTAAGEPQNGLSPEQQILFYTSKSGTIIPPSAIPGSEPATTGPAPTLMPGSKYIGNIISVDPGSLSPTPQGDKPSSAAQPSSQPAPTLMPGSKSFAPFPYLPGVSRPATTPPAVQPVSPQTSAPPR